MQIIELMKSLGHEARLRVLSLLTVQDSLCVCDFYEVLQLPQPTISRHLKLLRDAGLVVDFRENQWVHYKIHPEIKAAYQQVLNQILDVAKQQSLFQSDLNRLKKVKLAVCC